MDVEIFQKKYAILIFFLDSLEFSAYVPFINATNAPATRLAGGTRRPSDGRQGAPDGPAAGPAD
ncbi:MAG: hypothetical protein OXM58_06260 [Rhodospirillaceae bacterium]|nr:hypothetical protein [Rhodospirillaceae bacterium]MDE0618570.1 hypothetical protein [Rhodospirillaceae bacterium]